MLVMQAAKDKVVLHLDTDHIHGLRQVLHRNGNHHPHPQSNDENPQPDPPSLHSKNPSHPPETGVFGGLARPSLRPRLVIERLQQTHAEAFDADPHGFASIGPVRVQGVGTRGRER